jgi:hypothetical protein
MSRRLSLQEGFEQLLPYNTPALVAEKFNRAWHEDRLRLFCNGKLLSPGYISSNLLAVAEQEDDGRWRCIVVPHGARLGFNPSHPYVWEMDAEGIEALLPPPAPSQEETERTKRLRLQRQLAMAIVQRLYPNGVPDTEQTAIVRQKIQTEWAAECRAQKIDPASVNPPSYNTVKDILGRGKKPD